MIIEPIAQDPQLQRFLHRLAGQPALTHISGLWGSSASLVAAALAQGSRKSLLYITAHLQDADDVLDDLETFGAKNVRLFPAWEAEPGQGPASGEIEGERLRVCASLAAGREPSVIVAPIHAMMQPVPRRETLDRHTLHLVRGGRRDRDSLIGWLTERGFERLERVEAPGDFAVRGDIVDIFIAGEDHPLRVEFLDDVIESIRRFDISSQRSLEQQPSVSIPTPGGVAVDADNKQSTALFAYLPPETVVILDEPAEIQEFGQIYRKRVAHAERLLPVSDIFQHCASFAQVHVARIGGEGDSQGSVRFDVTSLTRFEGKASEAVAELCQAARDRAVYVFCDKPAERERLQEMLVESAGAVPASVHLLVGVVHHGFEWMTSAAAGYKPVPHTICIGYHELFRQQQRRHRIRKVRAGRPLDSFLELEPGDIVVHVMHGIARFVGMKTIRRDKTQDTEEFLTLEFADKATLHVPVSQIDLVQKYVASIAVKPKLSTLGGTRWKKTTERVEESVTGLAQSLLEIQAVREVQPGIAYPADTHWQREFEAAFAFDDTPDQVTVSADIKGDLCRTRPMDRLVCGDVGYGKTELAIRAAFKVVEYGKQVAVLAPTTVLAEQHFETFSERLAGFPFEVRCLSRFRSNKEQKEIVEEARKGRVDILIGTHRILSKDVRFADLGLLIVDEEQRFGVEHKNRIREFRPTVDVLTMTATPIPRTLHMSMLGIRDISSLTTPPMDRRAIATQVRNFDDELIREAVLREMNRDGQVYFVHNRVQSIYAVADELRRIVPEARVLVGHGQMKDGELEKVMTDFVHHKADVLLATTIIESGIDIPRANTIFIDTADRLGLADLHQLRGRVGRSHHRAYCYLLAPRDRPLTHKAVRRLKSIEEFSELGAGFRIAMRDLEIRGAGNILGPEQSGHIAAVGYEMFCQILESAVRQIKGEPDSRPRRVHLDLDTTGHLPGSYIPQPRLRIEVYKRIVGCSTIEDLRQAETDLTDAFGKYPESVARLLELAEIRVRAGKWGIRSIVLEGPDLVFRVDDRRKLEPVFQNAPGTVRTPDPHTIHWRLPPNFLEPASMLAVLRNRLARD